MKKMQILQGHAPEQAKLMAPSFISNASVPRYVALTISGIIITPNVSINRDTLKTFFF